MNPLSGDLLAFTNGISEVLRPITAASNDAHRSLASLSKSVDPATTPLVQSLGELNKSLEVTMAPFRQMAAIGAQRKADLKAAYVSNKTPDGSISKHRKWHAYFPELKPLEMMSEDEFDSNIKVFFSAAFPLINISHLECYVAEHGISREEIGAIGPWETAQFLNQLEDKFNDWEAHKKQCDEQVFEAFPVPVREISSHSKRLDQDRRFVIEGLKLLNSGEATSSNHAAGILLNKYGWAAKGLEPNAKGKIIASSHDSAVSRLQKKISKAL